MKTFRQFLMEAKKEHEEPGVWWHGSPSGDLRGASNGLHVGTKEAARQALTARIGHPVEGEWDGTRKYGETKLAGRNTLRKWEQERGKWYVSGYNCDAPDHDYYPHEHPKGFPVFGSSAQDRESRVSPDHKPSIVAYKIVGPMSNTPHSAHPDFKANGYMKAAIKKGQAKRGYYYRNDGEDYGSISAVVPNGGAHLRKIE